MKSFLRSMVAAFTIATAIAPAIANAETIFGLTMNDQLYSFDSALPGLTTPRIPITGLPPNEFLLGIDFRPVATNSPSAASNGVLYAVGATHHLYTINTTTGLATQVPGAPFALTGGVIGIDFNPVPDRLRVVSNSGENFRLDPNTGAVAGVDTPLAYVAGDPNFGGIPSIGAAAYTNNFGGATETTLYGIDYARNILVRQGGPGGVPSPNTGQLTTIGPLDFDTADELGFDISGQTGIAYASLTPIVGPLDIASELFTINLATGAATLVGPIGPAGGPGAFITRDIAARVGVPIPEPSTLGLLLLALATLAYRHHFRRS
jgi:uncharacterized protein DUF4394/PEP-CTERM motif-containing protein